MNFWGRMFWIGMWVKVVFMRYMAAWLIAEGGCIMIGELVTSSRPPVTSSHPLRSADGGNTSRGRWLDGGVMWCDLTMVGVEGLPVLLEQFVWSGVG